MGRHQCFARLTDQIDTAVELDAEAAGGVVDLLRHVFADALLLAATDAGGAVRLVVDLGTGQLGRQGLALGLALGGCGFA